MARSNATTLTCRSASNARFCRYRGHRLRHALGDETRQNLDLMRLIDPKFLEMPFLDARQMRWHLRNEGHAVNGKRVHRLMRLMGSWRSIRSPIPSRPAKGRRTYPYLLRGLRVDRPDQGRCVVAIMDWHTRMVLSRQISDTPE